MIDELFIFFLIVVCLHVHTVTSLVFLGFAVYFMYSLVFMLTRLYPRKLHEESSQLIHKMKLILFCFIACMSLYQLPLFPDGTSHPSSALSSLLPILGLTKWSSDSYEGMVMCLGDGITHSHMESVPCESYTSSTAMGFYSLLLFVIYLYVCLCTVYND